MEYIALEVFNLTGGGSKFLNLPSDTSITIVETSELFDTGDIWSFNFKINIPANAHIFGTAGEIHGSRMHDQIDKRKARLWLMGLPVYLGYLKLDDEVDVDAVGNVDISFESGRKTFHEMIDGIKANQVPIPDDILIGMAVDRERTLARDAQIDVTKSVDVFGNPAKTETFYVALSGDKDMAQAFPKFVRPDGTLTRLSDENPEVVVITTADTINTDYAYDAAHPYCNTRICYQKHIFKEINGEIEDEAQREPKISEPRRINPSPNFFFLYWLDCLLKHLSIHVTENQMLDIEDLRRLFFVNTKCSYTEAGPDYLFEEFPTGPNSPFVPPNKEDNPAWKIDCNIVGLNFGLSTLSARLRHAGSWAAAFDFLGRVWHKAYATSDNFPDVDISDVIDAIESGFGVRFMFNADYTKVRIVLLRNVLRSQEVHEVPCEVLEVTKRDNSIRGFRMTYGAGKEDTNYYYQGFEAVRQKQDEGWVIEGDGHDYSQWNTELHYTEIAGAVATLNKTCYVDSTTGNAYIVKIDENFKNASDEAHPSLFECSQFADAEDGDCTGEGETIKEVRIGFAPMIATAIPDNKGYALLVNETMGVSAEESSISMDTTSEAIREMMKDGLNIDSAGCTTMANKAYYQNGLFELATATMFTASQLNDHTITEFEIDGIKFTMSGWLRDGYRLYLQDNFKPGEDLTCPLEKPNWGLMFGIMRGSGSGENGATIGYQEDLIDGEGNDYWELKPGAIATAHSDTCDDNGKEWDYNGSVLCETPADAISEMRAQWSDSNFNLTERTAGTRLTEYHLVYVTNNLGNRIAVLLAKKYGSTDIKNTRLNTYAWEMFNGKTAEEMYAADRVGGSVGIYNYSNLLIEVGSSYQRGDLLLRLQGLAFGVGAPVTIDNGIGSADRISLKLRAEKPNPFFDPTQPESNENRRYLEITNPNLRHRGLMDKFHKEESYWWRNAKIAVMKCQIGMAELRSIDKTVRQNIGDVTGLVKKIQYTIDIQSGLGPANIEMWYL